MRKTALAVLLFLVCLNFADAMDLEIFDIQPFVGFHCKTLLYVIMSGIIPTTNGISEPQIGVRSMARRRYQRGAMRLEGDKWVLRWREDYLDDTGAVKRREVRAVVGTKQDLPTKPLARRVADKMIAHVNAPDYMPGRIATVEDFADVYVREVTPTMKPSSCESERGICNRYLVPILGKYRLDQINGQIPQTLVTAMRQRGLSRKTIKNALSTLSAMLTAASDWGYTVSSLDWRKIRLPADDVAREQRFFTPDEAQRLIEAAPLKWKTCFASMAYLGIRTGEAVGLSWHNIDLDNRVLQVRQSNWRGKITTVKSKTSCRDLPIPEPLYKLLVEYRDQWVANDLGLLFANAKGQPITSCYVRRDVLHPLRENLGIPRGAFHAFRHGVATAMFSLGGANAKVVQDQLGHAHIQTTMRYTHSISDDQRRAVERTAAAIAASTQPPPPPPPQVASSKVINLRDFAAKDERKLLRVK